MTDSFSRTLRSFPPLVPPKPKKAPSPRLTPRTRHSRRRFSLSQTQNQENNNAGPAPKRASISKNAFSIQTSPVTTAAASSSKGAPENPVPALELRHNLDFSPLSPTTTSGSASASAGGDPTAPNAKSDLSVFEFVDEASAPLTPRNLQMDSSAADAQITLTPPVNSPTPLVVSAKRFGSKVRRRSNTTKRRRPDDIDDAASDSEDDDTMKLPEGLSPSQKAKEYWKRCYGSKKPQELLVDPKLSWSAKRAAPAKSCLSHSKPKRSANILHANILLPPTSALLQSPHPTKGGPKKNSPLFSTPTSSPNEITAPQPKCSHSKSVQFGVALAAEYDLDAPAGRFTPMPPEIAQERFPLTSKKTEDEGEQEKIAETKENSAVLADWEKDFDDLLEDSEEPEEGKSVKQRKRQSSKRHRSSKRSKRGNRSDRRRSSTFCSPHKNAKALYDPTSDEEITPEKQSATVIDNMACLSVASPSPSPCHNESFEGPSDDDTTSTRSSSLSPVPARRLSAEAHDDSMEDHESVHPAIVSQDEMEATVTPPNNGLQAGLSADTNTMRNIWTEIATNPSVLSPDNEKWDMHSVFCNLALTPRPMWGPPLRNLDNDSDEDLVRISDGWHSSMQQPLHKALNLLSNKLEASATEASSKKSQEVPQDLRQKFEQMALAAWRLEEMDFLKNLVRETKRIHRQVAKKNIYLDTMVVPEQASLEPTRRQILEAEESIQVLEHMIKSETEKNLHLKQCLEFAQTQSALVQAPFAALSYHALCYLSPVDIAMSYNQNQAIFRHLLEGLETRLELDESANTTVRRTSQTDEISTFCNGMICGTSGQLQEGFVEMLQGTMPDMLLQLAATLGRVDLAALGLQQLSDVYNVSLLPLMEEGNPVLVVRIQLPQNTFLNAFYRRSNAKSLHWSLPSNVTVERDGEPALCLLANLMQLVDSSRSVLATAGFLQVACETVLQNLTPTPPA